MPAHDGGQYVETARSVLHAADHLAEGADKAKEYELHKVIVEQLLHQLQDPIQSTLGYDLTRDFGRMMSPAQRGEYAAGHVVYVGLGTGTFHCGEEGIDRTTYTTLRQQLLDGSLPNDAADAQTTLASDAIFDLYLWD